MKRTKKRIISKRTKIITCLLLIPWTLVGAASAYMFAPEMDQAVFVGNEATAVNRNVFAVNTTPVDIPQNILVDVHFFGREGCGYCKKGENFLNEYLTSEPNARLVYYDVVEDKEARKLFISLMRANGLPQVTPYTFVGGEIIRGFGGAETTGQKIITAVEHAKNGHDYDIEEYLDLENVIKNNNTQATSGTELLPDDDDNPGVEPLPDDDYPSIEIPFIGEINLKQFSLFSLSTILGLVDGFNPCALWVLMAFLLILMQIGNKKKMFYVAGMFIFAESVMYYLILNVWYNVWDFIGLDRIVTPMIGVFAMCCGVYFLYKYKKTRKKFTCDVTSLEQQSKIQKKIHKLINSPMTLATIVGIIGIALSVNVIEFACSIGIPQTFTGILELHELGFYARQWYIALYILAYMVDDIVVFGSALYGFNKLHTSEKYSKLSILVGGILMILLGVLLLFFPNALIF